MSKPPSGLQQNQKLLEFDKRITAGLNESLAGIDEAGRGPLAGPVVAACAIVRNPEFSVKIDDSKKLSSLQRDRAFDQIKQKCIISVATVDQERIDVINIYQATLEAMANAFNSLTARPKHVIVDGPMKLNLGQKVEYVPRADGLSLAVACASIVAKVVRDRIMTAFHDQYPQYGFIRHKGYGTPEHLNALQTHGPCSIHRRSFTPVAVSGRKR